MLTRKRFFDFGIILRILLLLGNTCTVSTLCCECQGHNVNIVDTRSILRSRTKVAHKRAVLQTNCILYFRTCYLIRNICLGNVDFFSNSDFQPAFKIKIMCFVSLFSHLSLLNFCTFKRSIPMILNILVIHIIVTCKTLMERNNDF